MQSSTATFWEQYKWYAVVILAVLIIQALLIARLLLTQTKRREAEKQSKRLARVAESEHRRLDAIVSNVPGTVWETIIDPATNERKTTYISDYVQQMLGYTPEEWLAQPPGFGVRIMDERDRDNAARESERVIATGQKGFIRFRWIAKDGRSVWTESYLNPVKDEQGRVTGLRGVTLDISERQAAEETLRETQEKERAILEAVPDLMFLHSPEGVCLDYHCKDERDLFVPPEKFLGKNVREFLPQTLIDSLIPALRRVHRDAEPQMFEFQLPKNGTSKCYEARLVASGANVLTVIRDVTARKRAEEAIKASEVNYREIFNAANDAIFVHDLQTGAVLDVNQRMCEMYGCTVSQARQLTVASFSSNEPPYTDQEARVLVEKAASGTPQLFEWHAKKITGELFWVEVNLRRVSLNDQECVLAVVRDITERKRAEQQLAQSHRNVSEVLESIGDAFCSVDKAFRFTYVNRKAEELWAARREDLIGRNFLEVFPQAAGSYAYQEIKRALEQNLQINFDALSSIINRWVDISIYPTPKGLSVYFRDINERKQALDKLRQSEEQFGKAFRANPQPMSITAVATGRYLDVNESFLIMSGFARDEVIGHTSLELNIWETPQARADFIRELQTKGRVRNCETRFRAKDGALRVLLSSAEQLEIAGEQCLLFASSDITERIEAEDALRTSEARLTLAHQASRMGTFELNIQTGVNIWSPELEAMYGLAPGSFGGTQHTWEELVHPEDRAHAAQTVERAFAKEGAVEDEWRVQWPDGSVRWLFGRFQVMKDAAGEPWRLTGINIDVTDRILAQQAVQESEARFRNMADTAPVMIWIAGEDKGCTYFNQQWLAFTGRTMEQELGTGWANGVHPSDFDKCLNIYETAFDGRQPFTMEYRLRRTDGIYRWVIDNGIPRFSSTGEFLGYIGSCVDITDRKESEASLVEAHEALETAYAEVNRLKTQLEEENTYLQEEIKLQHNFGEIVGNSDPLKYVLYKIEQVAPTDSTVLILGETGTGKELVARAIHTASLRRDRPMVKVNCAALSASLIESELFGHEKGAFTGAIARKVGRFELADGATIFLDEIGELSLELQVKLLRIIQEGELERLGSTRTLKVDVRIIAATNRNLKEQVSKGLFREDLWYRLEVFPITVPPLRQRREDIPILTEHFVQNFARKIGKEITSIAPNTINALRNYAWPGNVRELANVIERAVINSQSPVLRLYEQLGPTSVAAVDALGRSLEEVERDYIVQVLNNLSWKIEGSNGAAQALGLNPSTLRTRMVKLGIVKPKPSLVASR